MYTPNQRLPWGPRDLLASYATERNLMGVAGVYLVAGYSGPVVVPGAALTCIYIGQSNDIGRRLGEHRVSAMWSDHGYVPSWVDVVVEHREARRLDLERRLILAYSPLLNDRSP